MFLLKSTDLGPAAGLRQKNLTDKCDFLKNSGDLESAAGPWQKKRTKNECVCKVMVLVTAAVLWQEKNIRTVPLFFENKGFYYVSYCMTIHYFFFQPMRLQIPKSDHQLHL